METEFDYKKYCANTDEWEFKVNDFEFSCREMAIGEESAFFNYYIDNTGRHNLAKLRLVQMTNLIKQPFKSEWINHIFKTYYPGHKLENNTWIELNAGERLMFLEKLDTNFIGDIMKNITDHYLGKEVQVKNL